LETGITAQKEPVGDNTGQQGGHSSQNTQHLIDHLLLLFAAPFSSISSIHHKKNSKSRQEKICIRTPIKSHISQCRLKV
jgi:hypothetical protein